MSPGRVRPIAGKNFRNTYKQGEPARQHRVHLSGDFGRRRQHDPAMREECGREQHLQDPKHEVHVSLRSLRLRFGLCAEFSSTSDFAGAGHFTDFDVAEDPA